MHSIDLKGKVGLVTGVGNKWSLGWAIAQILHSAGMLLVFGYSRQRSRKAIEKLLTESGWDNVVLPDVIYDAEDDTQIERLFNFVEDEVGALHAFLHSIAFAPPEALQGEFGDTSREAFRTALNVSTFSFLKMSRCASELMVDGGSILTLSFLASQRVFPHYNVMGTAKAALEHSVRQLAFELGPRNIRVNTISAGPISTASARGVKGFGGFHHSYAENAPLRRNVSQEEVGKAALFLLSDLSSGVTGEVLHVDGGYNVLGAPLGEFPKADQRQKRGEACSGSPPNSFDENQSRLTA